ncbi:MAG: efflux RND transporter permease subunit, partial [Planctomycetota bacterium]
IWDEMRRKILAAQEKLPPDVRTTVIDDDFGDVYGVYIALSGQGYTYRELKDFVDLLRRELLLVQDVKRISLWGERPEAIYVEMDRDRMATLGISQEQIYRTLEAKNLAADGGRIKIGPEFIAMNPTGEFLSEQQFRDLLISDPGSPQQIFLGDVATIRRDYKDPPERILRVSSKIFSTTGGEVVDLFDTPDLDPSDPALDMTIVAGQPAIGLAISTVPGGNVVTMGEALSERMKELRPLAPIGMEFHVIALQSQSVVKSINGFIVNLAQAVIIVVVVLLIFMGVKSGLLIGFILFQTVCITFVFMNMWGVLLERISLGALIIALGMLVDNAIVVTESMKLRLEAGEDRMKAAREVVGQNQWPLLGSTVVAIIAFAAIGTSTHNTGEYCRSLFQVILISLLASWLTAVTVTPLLCVMIFRPKKAKPGKENADPYGGLLFRGYKAFLTMAIRFRPIVVLVVIAMFVGAVYGFRFLPNSFFPNSSRAQFMVDVWLPQGTHIAETEAAAAQLEEFVMSLDNTKDIASHVGAGGARFMLVYAPEQPNASYAQLLINVFDWQQIDDNIESIQDWATDNMPDALVFGKKFKLGPGEGGNIQMRFTGPDPDKLRAVANEAVAIVNADPMSKYARLDWMQPVKVLRPVLAEQQARNAGIERTDVALRLAASFEGVQVGVYREGTASIEDRLVPIISRAPEAERGAENAYDLQIYSPAADRMIPLRQVLKGYETSSENELIWRRNRLPSIKVHVDQTQGETSVLWSRLAPKIEQMFQERLDSGFLTSEYFMEWGGEHEDSVDAQAALSASMPVFVTLMVLVVIMLFNNLRQPLIIWLTVPLALIGVSAGLLAFGKPFDFMAILGALSLSGMLIKNAVVLMDQVNINRKLGMAPYDAVINSGVSRMRPVMMAAATTALGMLPLLQDIFFVSMAITIIFGLTFATVLTLVFVPVLYTMLYRIPRRAPAS